MSRSSRYTQTEVAAWYGVSRQAFQQARKREMRKEAENQLILEWVQNIRQRHPQMGGLKLYHELRPQMASLDISRGRDAFFKILRDKNLLVKQKRNRRKTTRSGLFHHPNLFADCVIDTVNQAWVGDITYLTTEEGFVYLALLTDAKSRFIVGYDLSTSLALEGCLRALNLALKHPKAKDLSGLIHHSDHGVQYTS